MRLRYVDHAGRHALRAALRSFMAQSLPRIDPGCPAGGQSSRHQRDSRHQSHRLLRRSWAATTRRQEALGLWPLGVVLVFELLSGFLAIECPIDRDAISVGSPV